MKLVFQFVGGARAGQSLELEARPSLRIGRRPENDVPFDPHRDLDVSGHHAEVRQEADGFYLYDTNSANGTFVAGTRVSRLRLINGQEVAFGANGPRLVIRFVETAAVAPVRSVVPQAAAAVAPAPGAPPVVASGPGAVAPASLSAASAGQAEAASIPSGKLVGQRTVAMMIDSALSKARENQNQGGVAKSTVFFKAMVGQAVKQSTRKFKIVAVLLVVVLLGAIGGFLVLRHFEQEAAVQAQGELKKQMTALITKQAGAKSEEERKAFSQKLEEINRRVMAKAPETAGKGIVQYNVNAVFLMAMEHASQGPTPKGFCTAFAIDTRMLATNAHCVVALEKYLGMGAKAFLVMNREPTKRYPILKYQRHPSYAPPSRTITEDVGLLLVGEDLPRKVDLAEEAQLKELDAGDVMYTYGFPGRLASVSSPSATLVQGVIGRVTKLDGESGAFGEHKLVQHSAFTSGGTSGSPIFNQAGKVIAVNTGGYVEPGTMQVMDPYTGRASNLRVAKQLAGYNFGIRIDVLRDLVRQSTLK